MNRNQRSGQSMIEAMIAISILTAGFLGIATLLVQSFSLSRSTSNDLTATYLASEGIEITKSIIDHDVYGSLATPPTGGGWDACCSGGGGTNTYTVDSESETLTPYFNPQSSNPPQYLHFEPATGLYDYSGSVVTGYNRWIQISTLNRYEIVVNSFVQWNNGTAKQTIDLEDHFYDWYPGAS